MQPGDIVESVDMEMSDDETDSKPKGRVLVDVRSQDRDMRIGVPSGSSHLDMDMRIIPLPSGQLPGPRGGGQDMRLMHSGPPPPPLPQFQRQDQGGFRQEQPEFSHRNQSVDFRSNQPNFRQNRPPSNFMPNQQDFHSNQQDFHQLHQFQQQDFEYRDREHGIRPKQDFLTDSPGRRYSQSSDHQHQRDGSSFHRNERNNRCGGGRGFTRNRRDRYSDDHNMKQRNLANNRKSRSQDQQHQSPPEILSNSRPLLQPPDTVIILDEKGIPIGMPDFDQDNVPPNIMEPQEHDSEKCQGSSNPQARRTSHDSERNQQQQQQQDCPLGSDHEQRAPSSTGSDDQSLINQVTVIPITVDNTGDDAQQQNQYVPISEYEEHVESEQSDLTEKTNTIDNSESIDRGQEMSFTENEQLDESTASSNELKKLSANGSFDEQSHEEGSPSKKRTLLLNGPHIPGADSCGPNGPLLHGVSMTEPHPIMINEYEGSNFRPRIGTPFPPWRGGPPPSRGGRGGFRGGPPPRGPWMDRGPPRGPATGNFSPRGLKRSSVQFRGGGGFRGRGRNNNW